MKSFPRVIELVGFSASKILKNMIRIERWLSIITKSFHNYNFDNSKSDLKTRGISYTWLRFKWNLKLKTQNIDFLSRFSVYFCAHHHWNGGTSESLGFIKSLLFLLFWYPLEQSDWWKSDEASSEQHHGTQTFPLNNSIRTLKIFDFPILRKGCSFDLLWTKLGSKITILR